MGSPPSPGKDIPELDDYEAYEEEDEEDEEGDEESEDEYDGWDGVVVSPGRPAVAIINILLQHYKAVFEKFKRNKRLSRAIWEEWNYLYEGISQHIHRVRNQDLPGKERRAAFKQYTAAIPPLER